MQIKFEVTDAYDLKRLDLAILSEVVGISRSALQKLFAEGKVCVDGEQCFKKNKIAHSGNVICVELEDADNLQKTPLAQSMDLDIVYEDDDLLVVNKERGIVVHPAPSHHEYTLVNGLLNHTGGKLAKTDDENRPGIVHRIDKDTSGLVVIAKTDIAYDGLRKQFDAHSIKRTYVAMVYNNIKEEQGKIDESIGRDCKDRKKRAVNGSAARRAVTHYKVIERFGNYTMIEANLETGRTHQIRVHMAYMGNPVVGDITYGPRKDKFKLSGQLLHARDLGFTHPATNELMFFTSELPEYFVKAMARIRHISR